MFRSDANHERGYRTPQRIVVAGASGLIGTALCAFLTGRGHRVDRMVRRPPQPGTAEIRWDPAKGEIDAAALDGAGENIAAGRWTAARKESILASRTDSTRLLCDTLARLGNAPRVLISASAVGYYGDRGDAVVIEQDRPGTGFLANVCKAWEAATEPARRIGIRVVNLRIGAVLSPAGGALARMLPAFRLGFGGRIGSGRQYMSWITLDDLVAAIHHLITAEDISGPVNAVAPEPVTNAEFTAALGRALHRPTLLAMPAFAVRLAFGEMGDELLLRGARAKPTRLQVSGFEFRDPQLEPALRRILTGETGTR
jgi:uncharacterized protein (TIGR01777 family)